jgi:hypothetical protein
MEHVLLGLRYLRSASQTIELIERGNPFFKVFSPQTNINNVNTVENENWHELMGSPLLSLLPRLDSI